MNPMNLTPKPGRRTALFLALSLFGHAGASGDAAGHDSEDESAIRKTIAQYEQGWNTHDGYMLGSCFTDNADFLNIFGDRTSGRSQIEKDLTVSHYDDPRSPFRHSSMHMKVEKITILAPTAAVAIVSFDLTGTGIAAIDGPHIGVRVMQKVQDKWLIQTFENTKIRVKAKPAQ
jgi:uncharacterized protein (TIGR02246 family)